MEYPFKKITLEDIEKDFKKLKEITKYYQTHKNTGLKILNYFFEKEKIKTKGFKNISHEDVFLNKKELEKHILRVKKLYKITDNNKIKDYQLRSLLSLNYGSICMFKPTSAMYIYHFFKSKVGILDPCAGWGGRLLGAIVYDINYIGIDSNKNLINCYHNLINKFGDKTKHKFICSYSENLDFSLFNYDLFMTSPPYEYIEKYENMKIYNNFYEDFLFKIFHNGFKHLKKGGWLVLNINKKMYKKIKEKFFKCDIKLPFLLRKRNLNNNKKYEEFFYCWYKKLN